MSRVRVEPGTCDVCVARHKNWNGSGDPPDEVQDAKYVVGRYGAPTRVCVRDLAPELDRRFKDLLCEEVFSIEQEKGAP